MVPRAAEAAADHHVGASRIGRGDKLSNLGRWVLAVAVDLHDPSETLSDGEVETGLESATDAEIDGELQ